MTNILFAVDEYTDHHDNYSKWDSIFKKKPKVNPKQYYDDYDEFFVEQSQSPASSEIYCSKSEQTSF